MEKVHIQRVGAGDFHHGILHFPANYATTKLLRLSDEESDDAQGEKETGKNAATVKLK